MTVAAAALLLLALSLMAALVGAVVIVGDRRAGAEWARTVRNVDSPKGVATKRLEAWVNATRPGRLVTTRLSAADIQIGAARALVLAAGGAGMIFVAVNTVAPRWVALFAVAVACVAAGRALARRRRARAKLFVQQLPDVAMAMAAASQRRTVVSALERASERVQDPAASVLRQVVGRTRLGWSLADSLGELRREIPDPEVRLLISTLIVNDTAGGDLATALRAIAAALTARQQVIREARTLLSGPLAASRVVAAVGVVMPFALNAISDGALQDLIRTRVGLVVLCSAVALYAVGLLLIRRVGRVLP